MDARYIMDYTGFELMYEGIRHTDVEEHAEEWQLTPEQVETLKERLLEEENRVYKYWLDNLPHFAVFEPDDEEDDEDLHLFYDWDASDDNRLGADALTTIARDLIERVGHATGWSQRAFSRHLPTTPTSSRFSSAILTNARTTMTRSSAPRPARRTRPRLRFSPQAGDRHP